MMLVSLWELRSFIETSGAIRSKLSVWTSGQTEVLAKLSKATRLECGSIAAVLLHQPNGLDSRWREAADRETINEKYGRMTFGKNDEWLSKWRKSEWWVERALDLADIFGGPVDDANRVRPAPPSRRLISAIRRMQ